MTSRTPSYGAGRPGRSPAAADATAPGPDYPRVYRAARAAPRAARRPRYRSARRARIARRRLAALSATVAAIALGAGVIWPTLHHAVRQLSLPLRHADIIRQQARSKHLDPALIAAVIYTESHFSDQTSSAGALGLMQLLPDTANFIAQHSGATRFSLSDLSTPQVNIAYGSWYLRYLLGRYGGNEGLAVAAYNAGEANVDRWIAAGRQTGSGVTISAIPFPETRAYVAHVLAAQQAYRSQYASQLGLSG